MTDDTREYPSSTVKVICPEMGLQRVRSMISDDTREYPALAQGTVKLFCPAMAVHRIGPHLWQTAAEPMTPTVIMNGVDISSKFGVVTIPPTPVHIVRLLDSMAALRLASIDFSNGLVHLADVDPCAGDNATGTFHVDLPQEPVVLQFKPNLEIVAKRIDSTGWFMLGDVMYTFKGSFPDASFALFGGQASPVTAEFTIS